MGISTHSSFNRKIDRWRPFAGVKAQNSSFLAHIEENAVQVMLSWATKKTIYKGFKILVGWKILPVFSGVHLDPSRYSNPEEFNPWRWQADDTRETISGRNDFTPFAGGKRLCPGYELASQA